MRQWKLLFLAPLLLTYAFLRALVDAAVRIASPLVTKHNINKNQLLIIRLDAIGDFMLFLDTFKEFRKLYPADKWEITLLGNKIWADLTINLPYADRYWFIDRNMFHRNPFYRYKILNRVKKAGFDAVIQPSISREYAFGDSIIRISNASDRIGSLGDFSNITPQKKHKSDRWYTKLIPVSGQTVIEIERNAEFLRGLGLREFQASSPVYPEDSLHELPLNPYYNIDKPYFVIFPGASSAVRMWQESGFADVAECIHKQTGWAPVLCGGISEKLIAQKVISFRTELPWKNFAGETTLVHLLKILKNAKLLVANETSVVHLASSVGCPTICIMGGGHFGRFFPYGNPDRNHIVYKKMDCYGCNWLCIYSRVRCIEEITSEDVWQEVNKVLEKFYAETM